MSDPPRQYTLAYDPPASVRDPRPRVIFWYRAYAALMLLVSTLALAFATFVAWFHTRPQTGLIMVLVAVTLVAFYGTATFMPLKPWAWTFGLVVIALGIPNLVTMAFCVPMFLAWRKPLVKAAFCRL